MLTRSRLRISGRLCGLDGVCFQTFGLGAVGGRNLQSSAHAWLQVMDGNDER